jgi:hypothetical protein
MILRAFFSALLRPIILALSLAASWFGGRKAAQTDAKIVELEQYANTRRKLDEVGRMSDADAARAWLRERGKSKRDL